MKTKCEIKKAQEVVAFMRLRICNARCRNIPKFKIGKGWRLRKKDLIPLNMQMPVMMFQEPFPAKKMISSVLMDSNG